MVCAPPPPPQEMKGKAGVGGTGRDWKKSRDTLNMLAVAPPAPEGRPGAQLHRALRSAAHSWVSSRQTSGPTALALMDRLWPEARSAAQGGRSTAGGRHEGGKDERGVREGLDQRGQGQRWRKLT